LDPDRGSPEGNALAADAAPEAFVIEILMYFGVGFLTASLIGLIIIPLVHNRAVRLTKRRLEAATPLSMAEIQADKDHLRAEFAVSTRRLELTVDQLKARSTSQLRELSKKSEAIALLKQELDHKSAAMVALEERERTMREQITLTEQEHSVKAAAVHETGRALADKEAALGRLTAELGERAMLTDTQKAEITLLNTQVDALKTQLGRYEKDVRDAEQRLTRERSDADSATKELSDERNKVENLGGRVTQLQRQLVAQATDAEILGRRVQDLETRLTEQDRLLVEREHALYRLRTELDAARRTEADLRAQVGASGTQRRELTNSARADTTQLRVQLAQANEERARLHHEITVMKRETEHAWTSERVENALLRERINDIAAEIARLTMALEGPGSPIESILAAAPATNGANGAGAGQGHGAIPGGNLADRIRALQRRASRVPSAS
jgi:chromosome segregation ATPase